MKLNIFFQLHSRLNNPQKLNPAHQAHRTSFSFSRRQCFLSSLVLLCFAWNMVSPSPSSANNVCFAYPIHHLGLRFRVTFSPKPYPCTFLIWHFHTELFCLIYCSSLPKRPWSGRAGIVYIRFPVCIPSTWYLALSRCLWVQMQRGEQVPPRELWHPAHLVYELVRFCITFENEYCIPHCGYSMVPRILVSLSPIHF